MIGCLKNTAMIMAFIVFLAICAVCGIGFVIGP